jgi:hypothetical protein
MSKRGYERKETPMGAGRDHPNTRLIRWVGDRTDLGLVKNETYTWKELGAAVGIVASSMRGRVRGAPEVSDCHMWANGTRKPKEEWGITTIVRCESKADKISQKYLRMKL